MIIVRLFKRAAFRRFHTSNIVCLDPKNVEEVRIPVPWGHVAGRWWGDRDVQPVVSLHGLLDNAATFDTLAPLLKTPSLLSLDLPGHGYSSHVPSGIMHHHLDYIIFLRHILKNHFKWKDLILLGHSYGGSLWFLYSTMYPHDVKKYISIDGATYTIAPNEKKTASHISKAFKLHLSLEKKLENQPPEYNFEDLVEVMHSSRKKAGLKISWEACKVLLSRGAVKTTNDKYFLSRDLRLNSFAVGVPTINLIFSLSEQILCDVLYIRTTDTIVSGDLLKSYGKSLTLMKHSSKRVESELVDGGHHCHLENPERMAPLINQFLSYETL